MHQTRKSASQNQQPDQWVQTVNGVWLPNSIKQTPIVSSSKQRIRQRISWTRWRIAEKSLWDWMSLLLVPLLIGIGTIWVTNRQTDAQNALSAQLHQSDSEQAQQIRWDDLLRQYRDGIDTLLLSNGLRQSHPGDDVSEIAHARTLDVLNAIDPSRRGSVVTYLSNLKLVQGAFYDAKGWHQQKIIISLSRADLSYARFSYVDLSRVDLTEADLSYASLSHADLTEASLSHANLYDSDLSSDDLYDSNLSSADLSYSSFYDSDLSYADLSHANLAGASLSHADLSHADLSHADLSHAILVAQQLHSAYSLSGTTLPNGYVCKQRSEANSFKAEKQAENRDTCLRKAGYM